MLRQLNNEVVRRTPFFLSVGSAIRSPPLPCGVENRNFRWNKMFQNRLFFITTTEWLNHIRGPVLSAHKVTCTRASRRNFACESARFYLRASQREPDESVSRRYDDIFVRGYYRLHIQSMPKLSAFFPFQRISSGIDSCLEENRSVGRFGEYSTGSRIPWRRTMPIWN